MYIKTLELQNFKIHRDLKVEFSNITAIVGKNARGKTSILDALSYGLYGVTGDGATKKELLTNSSTLISNEISPKNGKVTITFDNNFKIIRDLASSVQLLDDKGVKITDKATDIETWLNIPKDMFLTLIYGIQGKISESFLKFNANQKDFIDNLFAINDYMDPILEKLSETKKSINFQYNEILAKKNNKTNIEDYIKNTLAAFNCDSIDDLTQKINDVENQIEKFGDIEKLSLIKQSQSSIQSQYSYTENDIKYTSNEIETCENNFNNLKNKLNESSEKIKNTFNLEVTDLTTEPMLKTYVNNMCDIETWFNNLLNVINSINIENIDNNKAQAIQIINYIKQIDQYRTFYNQIISEWNNIKINLNNNYSNLSKFKSKLEKLQSDSIILKENLNNVNSELAVCGADGEGSNISIYKNLLSSLTNMKSCKSNLENYMNQIKNITFDESEFLKIDELKNKITVIEDIFKREGFPQFVRKLYINDIASMMNEMLLSFGFDTLLPVTVNESGEFLYRGVKTRSISGAQKLCTSIIQKFIYGRILAPGMKLGVMILDEPTDGLDSARIDYFRDFLVILNKNLGMQLIIVTHNKNIIPENACVVEL